MFIIYVIYARSAVQENYGFLNSRASPYQTGICQIRLQAADLPSSCLALLIATVDIIS